MVVTSCSWRIGLACGSSERLRSVVGAVAAVSRRDIPQFAEDELGVRAKGRRPAFRREHDPIIGVLDDQTEQITTHDQG